jgi:chromosome partitioning protein
MSDVFEGKKRIVDIIIPGMRSNLDVAPSNVRLADMELTLVNMNFREVRLKRALEPVLSRYEYIFLDCPPNLGLFTINALIAVTDVLIPMARDTIASLQTRSRLSSAQEKQDWDKHLGCCI